MDPDFELNVKRIIEEFHHRRQLGIREPTVSEERVRKFLTKIGEEIQRTGDLHKDVVDQLLRQTKDGVS